MNLPPSASAATLTLTIFGTALLISSDLHAASQKFTTSGFFTPPDGITSVTVECWGGGGAGGSAQRLTSTSGGGGGGGGAYARKLNVPVIPGTQYTITIPPAAAGAPAGFATGDRVDGASVTFTGENGVSVTANGGQGGQCAVNATGTFGAGGAAGDGLDGAFAGGNGATHTSGNAGAGGSGASDLGPGNAGAGSAAGATKAGSDVDHNGGAGGTGKTGAGNGNGGAAQPGGGGGGAKASANNTSFTGSSGARGQIIITFSGAAVSKADNMENLGTGTSWVGGNPPDAAGIARWDATVKTANTTSLDADVTWGGITIANPGGRVTINAGNLLTLNGAIDMSAATADLTLNCDLALGGSAVWNLAAGRTLTLGGLVSGSFNVTQQGSGKVILSAANTYSGATAVNGGTLQLGADNVIPHGGGKGNVSVAATSTLDLNSFSGTINGLSGAGIVDNTAAGTTSTLTVGGNNADSSFGGVIQNSGALSTTNLVKTGSGQLSLTGVHTFTGTATVTGGNLTLANVNPLGNISGLTIGGALLGCSANNSVIAAPITLAGNLTVIVQNSGVLANLNGAIGGTGNLTFATGNNTLNGDNRVSIGAPGDFTGNITITTSAVTLVNNMTVLLGAVNALPATAVVTLDGQNGNGTSWCDLNLSGFDQTLAGLTSVTRSSRLQRVYNGGVTPAILTIDNAADYTFGGTLGKAGANDFALTKSGFGTFTLTGANTYTGPTTVKGGTLALGAGNVLENNTAVSLGSATLSIGDGFADTVGTLDAAGPATIMVGAGATLAFADSSAIDWTGGSVAITGSFVSGGSLRFGETNMGLTADQIAKFAGEGLSGFALDGNGFLTASGGSAYNAWSAANAGGQGPELDWDLDGVGNGVEYFMNASAGFTALPTLNASRTITWPNGGKIPASAYGTRFVVQTSSNLLTWTDVPAGSLTTNTDGPGGSLTYTLPTGGPPFVRLKVTPN